MANFKQVNAAIKKAFPELDIQAIRGDGYVYFDGNDGFDKLESIYTNPVQVNTDALVKMVIADIQAMLDTAKVQAELLKNIKPFVHVPEVVPVVKARPVVTKALLKFYNFLLFSVVTQSLPNVVRYWAYDRRAKVWDTDPRFNDLAAAQGTASFDFATWKRQRAMERDSVVLARPIFIRKNQAQA